MRRISNIGMLCSCLIAVSILSSRAQVFTAGFSQVLVANGITNPTVMAFAPDGRIFVAQQGGSLRVIKNNVLLATPFITLTVNSSGERGLIGIALDPDFSSNNYIYLYYTVPVAPIHNRVSRFTANGDVVLPGSETILLELDQLSGATNHNGGAMHFGKDGKLYVAVGENANTVHAQNLDTYHGKLLRINKDGSVPEGNPFTTGTEQRRRIWSYGLRNPYTFAVHPEAGRILVNDVGQGTWEEINDATVGGRNFGWPATEGSFNQTTFPGYTNPIFAYPHGGGDGRGCAITGGVFFNPVTTNYPATMFGRYFFQDLCNNWINTLDLSGGTVVPAAFATSIAGNGLSITMGNDGNLYYLSRSAGALYKIVYNNTTTPFITNQPDGVVVADGQPASFQVSASGSMPLTYQWQKNNVDIPNAMASIFTIQAVTNADAGDYRVIVSNGAGTVISDAATLSVIINTKPVAEIITPEAGITYIAGTEITFSGSGTDAEDGQLPSGAFSWQVNFHHDTHIHDEPPVAGVSSGSFLIPNEGETSDNVWYRIILTATDSEGMTGKDSVDINPRKSTFNFATNPPGLQILLDGQPLETPASVVSVEGMLRTIGVVTPQIKNDVTHNFESWSYGGPSTQTLVTPAYNLSLTAQFSIVVGTEGNLSEDVVSIFPNPSLNRQVTIRIRSASDQRAQIRFVDMLSRDLISQQHELHAGENELSFNFGPVQNGIYSLVVELPDRTISRRLLVED